MTLGMNVILAITTVAALIRAFTLMIRYLQDGIAYLRNSVIVLDVAMPAQGLGVAILAAIATTITLIVDPHYADGPGVLLLSVLGASGGLGLLSAILFPMSLSDMRLSIEYGQPLFLRDRTPGCRSRRRVVIETY